MRKYLYIYIYIYISIYMYICIYMYTCICIHIYIYKYVCTHTLLNSSQHCWNTTCRRLLSKLRFTAAAGVAGYKHAHSRHKVWDPYSVTQRCSRLENLKKKAQKRVPLSVCTPSRHKVWDPHSRTQRCSRLENLEKKSTKKSLFECVYTFPPQSISAPYHSVVVWESGKKKSLEMCTRSRHKVCHSYSVAQRRS